MMADQQSSQNSDLFVEEDWDGDSGGASSSDDASSSNDNDELHHASHHGQLHGIYPKVLLRHYLGEETNEKHLSGGIVRHMSDAEAIDTLGRQRCILTMSTRRKYNSPDCKACIVFLPFQQGGHSFQYSFMFESSTTKTEFGCGLVTKNALQARKNALKRNVPPQESPSFHPAGMVGWNQGELGWHADDNLLYMSSDDPDEPNKLGLKPSRSMSAGELISVYVHDECFSVYNSKSHLLLSMAMPKEMLREPLYGALTWSPLSTIKVTLL